MQLISVNILNFNQKHILKDCIISVLEQSYENLEIIVTDNSSSVELQDVIRNERYSIKFIRNTVNKGYSKANNDFIYTAKGEYLLFLNADVVLDINFIEKMLKAIEKDKKIGIVQGKLYRMQPENKKGEILDSTGIILCKNRKNLDRGFNLKDIAQDDDRNYIFGASGAALFCRREMLEDVKINNEYFDEDFFAYREEVDLAWRAQLFGWKCVYVPNAIAYHYRNYAPDRRKMMPKELKRLQYRNRYLMLIKNELPLTFILHLPYILFFETASFFYVLFCEPFLIKVWPEIIKLIPTMLNKRRQIMKKRKVSADYILSIIK